MVDLNFPKIFLYKRKKVELLLFFSVTLTAGVLLAC